MKNILIIDDDSLLQSFLRDALYRDFCVETACNGQQALEYLGKHNYDLIITDLVMPELNGIELVMRLQKTNPEQKIIAISGGGGINGRFDYLSVAQLIGACKVLRKPFSIVELRNVIEATFKESPKNIGFNSQ